MHESRPGPGSGRKTPLLYSGHASPYSPADRHRPRRRRPGRLRPPDRRAVDDQHRHGRRRRRRCDQVAALARAGSELVRVTVNNEEAAAAVPADRRGPRSARRRASPSSATSTTTATCCSPSIPAAPRALAKYRINPGNVGGKRHDENFRTIIEVALEQRKPVRIGVNWGSLDQELLTEMMDANAASARPAGRARRHDGGDGGERAPDRRRSPRPSGCRTTGSS